VADPTAKGPQRSGTLMLGMCMCEGSSGLHDWTLLCLCMMTASLFVQQCIQRKATHHCMLYTGVSDLEVDQSRVLRASKHYKAQPLSDGSLLRHLQQTMTCCPKVHQPPGCCGGRRRRMAMRADTAMAPDSVNQVAA
jgi:hypothetical protein